jgi:hypothetical protein
MHHATSIMALQLLAGCKHAPLAASRLQTAAKHADTQDHIDGPMGMQMHHAGHTFCSHHHHQTTRLSHSINAINAIGPTFCSVVCVLVRVPSTHIRVLARL